MSDKLKPHRNGLFKTFNKPTEVRYEPLTQDGKTTYANRNQLIPFYPEEPNFALFSHSIIQWKKILN